MQLSVLSASEDAQCRLSGLQVVKNQEEHRLGDVFALLPTQSCEKERRSQECERRTLGACATGLLRRDVVESDQVDILTLAVLGYFEQVD